MWTSCFQGRSWRPALFFFFFGVSQRANIGEVSAHQLFQASEKIPVSTKLGNEEPALLAASKEVCTQSLSGKTWQAAVFSAPSVLSLRRRAAKSAHTHGTTASCYSGPVGLINISSVEPQRDRAPISPWAGLQIWGVRSVVQTLHSLWKSWELEDPSWLHGVAVLELEFMMKWCLSLS